MPLLDLNLLNIIHERVAVQDEDVIYNTILLRRYVLMNKMIES